MNDLLKTAVQTAILAGKEILKVYSKDFDISFKNDNSPLTEADTKANKLITESLNSTNIPIISEENEQIPFSKRKNWNTCWIVDPLDGTKEFIKKNGEFTVNIALCENGMPILGVIYVPVSRVVYYADVRKGSAFKTVLSRDHEWENPFFRSGDRIFSEKPVTKKIKVVGSRSHMNKETSDFVDNLKKSYENVEVVSVGSSLKFCLMAEGKAHLYPRFAPTMEWDTAAGHAICLAVGLSVISIESGMDLSYNKKSLVNPHFIVKHA